MNITNTCKFGLPLLTLALIGCKNSSSDQSNSQQLNQSYLKINMNLDSKTQQQKNEVSLNQFTNVLNFNIIVKTKCGNNESTQEIMETSTGILLEQEKNCTITIEKFALQNKNDYYLPVRINDPLIIQATWENNFHKISNENSINYRHDSTVKLIKNSTRTQSNQSLDLNLFENSIENIDYNLISEGDFISAGLNLKYLPAPNPTKKPTFSYRKVDNKKQYKISLQNETKLWDNCAIVKTAELGDLSWNLINTAYANISNQTNCKNLVLNQDNNWTAFASENHTIIYANVSSQGNSYKLLKIKLN